MCVISLPNGDDILVSMPGLSGDIVDQVVIFLESHVQILPLDLGYAAGTLMRAVFLFGIIFQG